MTDDLDVFPTMAQIPDTMLRKVDPVDPVLLAYLQTINPSIENGFLLGKGVVGTSKRTKSSKKVTKANPLYRSLILLLKRFLSLLLCQLRRKQRNMFKRRLFKNLIRWACLESLGFSSI